MNGRIFSPVLTAIVTIALSAILVGCTKPSASNEATFTTALEPLIVDRFCRVVLVQLVTITAFSAGMTPPLLPLIRPVKPLSYSAAKQREAAGRSLFAAAVGERLLTRSTANTPTRRWDGTESFISMRLIVFTPRKAGKAVFRSTQREAGDHRNNAYPATCTGRGHIGWVVRCTDPVVMAG